MKRPCSACGTLRAVTAKSLPVIVCQPCRRLRTDRKPMRNTPSPCVDCGGKAWGIRCRPCRDIDQRVRPLDDVRVRRREREATAPGLNQTARGRLLAKWKRQGRACTYCPALATTIDHVVSLVRGGTNFEGNLTPACRRCNSSKAHRLLVEWRHVAVRKVA